VKAVIKICC